MTYSEFFKIATGQTPFPYQAAHAESEHFPALLEVPTGGGKTAFAVLSWLWRRRFGVKRLREATPRRLVYCLPVRTLVDQTASVTRRWLMNLGLDGEIAVHALLGGAVDQSWDLFPEREAILIGTQDQLLSRALNRGYSMSRYRWPVHFGLLNNDVLWVLDETQLMGVGLSTSAQLQAFRERHATYGEARTLWMSATLEPHKLATVDFRGAAQLNVARITSADRSDPRLARRLDAVKRLTRAPMTTDDSAYSKVLAREVVKSHQPDTLTLVILNRVARAQDLYKATKHIAGTTPVALIHSRFRPADRATLQNEVLSGRWSGIIIATQAVEAGVDISARTLFTELAPWPSLVQRFGRCNRAGEFDSSDVHWIDIPNDEKLALPYEISELTAARALLESLDQVGIENLPRVPAAGEPAGPVLRQRDLNELFDTQPDLTGCDVDVSRYIRATDDRDVQVYWRSWDLSGDPPEDEPHRDELCTAPCWEVADVAKRIKGLTLRWNGLLKQWERAERIVPGMQILLHSSAGGYDSEVGWLPSSKRPVEPVIRQTAPLDADQREESSTIASRFITIAEHTRDVVDELTAILATAPTDVPAVALRKAALWHDVGKAHPAFQEMLLSGLAPEDPHRTGGPWAKSAAGRGGKISRPYFRHELASSLGLLASGGSDLEAYLIAAHHGKVRLSVRSRPGEQVGTDGRKTVLGVQDGDEIGPIVFDDLNMLRVELRLTVAVMGEHDGSPSWLARMLGLVGSLGPFRLAYLEALLRAADWRASDRARNPVPAEAV